MIIGDYPASRMPYLVTMRGVAALGMVGVMRALRVGMRFKAR